MECKEAYNQFAALSSKQEDIINSAMNQIKGNEPLDFSVINKKNIIEHANSIKSFKQKLSAYQFMLEHIRPKDTIEIPKKYTQFEHIGGEHEITRILHVDSKDITFVGKSSQSENGYHFFKRDVETGEVMELPYDFEENVDISSIKYIGDSTYLYYLINEPEYCHIVDISDEASFETYFFENSMPNAYDNILPKQDLLFHRRRHFDVFTKKENGSAYELTFEGKCGDDLNVIRGTHIHSDGSFFVFGLGNGNKPQLYRNVRTESGAYEQQLLPIELNNFFPEDKLKTTHFKLSELNPTTILVRSVSCAESCILKINSDGTCSLVKFSQNYLSADIHPVSDSVFLTYGDAERDSIVGYEIDDDKLVPKGELFHTSLITNSSSRFCTQGRINSMYVLPNGNVLIKSKHDYFILKP